MEGQREGWDVRIRATVDRFLTSFLQQYCFIAINEPFVIHLQLDKQLDRHSDASLLSFHDFRSAVQHCLPFFFHSALNTVSLLVRVHPVAAQRF